MRDFFKNNPELKKYFYILVLVIIAIIFYRYTENMRVDNVIPIIYNVLKPFIYGAIFAYIMNSPTRFLEHNIKRIPYFSTRTSKAKSLSIAAAFVILIGIIIAIVSYIIPELTKSMQNVASFLLKFDSDSIEKILKNTAEKFSLTFTEETYNAVAASAIGFIDVIMESISNMSNVPDMFGSVMAQAFSIASSIFTVILSLVISIYVLAYKEKLGRYAGKIMYCFFSRRRALSLMSLAVHCNDVFERFFVGKIIDSVIIGVIFFVGAVILNLPFPLFFSLVIGITNIIPYFGPFIGGIPVVFLTLLYSPIMGLWVLLFVIVLQQFDGVILGPKILGDSIGISPLGVIFAIVVGGSAAGILGMFFGVPIFSVISELLNDVIEKNYNAKAITGASSRGEKQKYHSKRSRHNRGGSANNKNKQTKTKLVLKFDTPIVKMPRIIEGKKRTDTNIKNPIRDENIKNADGGGSSAKKTNAKAGGTSRRDGSRYSGKNPGSRPKNTNTGRQTARKSNPPGQKAAADNNKTTVAANAEKGDTLK